MPLRFADAASEAVMICETTRSERIAYITWRMAQGWKPTTVEIAAATGVTIRTVQRMLTEVRTVPFHRLDDGRWMIIDLEADEVIISPF